MKSMRQMQEEMFWMHQAMPEDKDGYPKLHIGCTGIVHIIKDKEQEDWERRANTVALLVGIVLVPAILGLIHYFN